MTRNGPRLALVLATLTLASGARAQTLPTGFADSVVVSPLNVPVAIEFLPDGRLLVAEQVNHDVRLVVNGALSTTDPVFTVPTVMTGGERGLLGLAVDPAFPAKPYLYTHQTLVGDTITIARWTLSGDLAFTGDGHLTVDPASRYVLISNIPDQASNHNGGTVHFGPDGSLYVSLGEDADACGSQDPTLLKGKILRLDTSRLPAGPGFATRALITPADNPFVASPDTNQRILAAYGLRNPFRFQVDRAHDWLVIGDVGSGLYEEIDLLNASSSAAPGAAPWGSNFGWPWFEGFVTLTTCTGSVPTAVSPVYAFPHLSGMTALICAGMYEPVTGAAWNWPASYTGNIFFSEYYSGMVIRLTLQGGSWQVAPDVPGQPATGQWAGGYDTASDWRVGPDGALWYCREFTAGYAGPGVIGRIAPGTSSPPPPPPPPTPPIALTVGPLPGSGSLTLSYDLPGAMRTRLRLYDSRGRRVRSLTPLATEAAGPHSVTWTGHDDDGRSLPAGLYWAQLEAGGRRLERKIAWLR